MLTKRQRHYEFRANHFDHCKDEMMVFEDGEWIARLIHRRPDFEPYVIWFTQYPAVDAMRAIVAFLETNDGH